MKYQQEAKCKITTLQSDFLPFKNFQGFFHEFLIVRNGIQEFYQILISRSQTTLQSDFLSFKNFQGFLHGLLIVRNGIQEFYQILISRSQM
ncbi:hypothetical protein GLOIN_2v1628225 [Rhizophagus irregularis DAOM 181602=DAOM 197198]|uniref:Uncharacterized protein n=1 Tax=Rhizophagus irregularis (strain DAOM 181602 / DAOM 197198 / MUCL 43194) TaxID=747089 RepID=U9UKK7_RHIID|nr:hypothetical protein GLOIN_2v1628225 [Rhizophagus irregularis DAOM 181602=DAOM 197198]POG69294.1 hypothetical protein GLOIN_2v1628225 [Rhizophagus irregularis DAOM 181602=DAOM 197198]GBC50503.1 hypothetical protein GLOIN_2v1628225 [Rhizophagus irregularis DAOM 181602=DAOM 197198]|eukprot:XP_025176160.1 hypothetical protein GLOIN_2v1628225 [Rhizophagus irregularis DAOM 181602=DAOM 197198]